MKTVGLYRVKNEARWIAESLQRTLQCAQHVCLLDDHSTDNTVEIAQVYKGVEIFRSPFQGLDEARDREFLLHAAIFSNADWVLFLDGDEVLTPSAVREVQQIVALNIGGVFTFRIAYLWDSPHKERQDNMYRNFHAPRLFSLFDQDKSKLHYRTTDHGGNLHCGQVPRGMVGPFRQAHSPIKHYGYMLQEDRERKHKFYNEVDTAQGRAREGNYDHVLGKSNKLTTEPFRVVDFSDD